MTAESPPGGPVRRGGRRARRLPGAVPRPAPALSATLAAGAPPARARPAGPVPAGPVPAGAPPAGAPPARARPAGTLPDDLTLTEAGLAAAGGGRVLLLACGALAREILALKAANGWDHLDLHCLPAILHNHPERITPAVEAAVEAARGRYGQVFVVYADCGTGGALARACARLGVEMVAGPHCYAFFDGLDAFAGRAEEEAGAFYLTDFLVRQFDAFVIRPLGLDRHPGLRDLYFGNYDRLVYLAQTEDAALDALARATAARLGLAFHRRPTGYGDLAPALARAAAGGAREKDGRG
ncbi:MAG: DUF1638 domain-containing protein [Rhodobacteraceae bacterium]|nr:DUF1638 domain-containing protein [Paracoccaceae bacterium]